MFRTDAVRMKDQANGAKEEATEAKKIALEAHAPLAIANAEFARYREQVARDYVNSRHYPRSGAPRGTGGARDRDAALAADPARDRGASPLTAKGRARSALRFKSA